MTTTERTKRIRTLAALVVAAGAVVALGLLLISAKPTQAAPVSFSSASNQTITVPGGEDSLWFFWNRAGTDNGLPVGGSWNASPGLSVEDAGLDTATSVLGDAFDNGLTVFVNNQRYVSPDTVDLTGTTLTSGPVTLADLNTSVQYYVSPTNATLRTFISLNNPTTNSITVPVTVATNLGSDTLTQIINTSSGDTTFTTSDSYIITDDSSSDFSDPTVTSLVAAGSGSPRAQPSAVSNTVFADSGTQGVLVTYDVTVPAGQTRSVLLFNQLNATPTEATADVGVFNDNTTLAATDFLAGLSQADLATVVNFDFSTTSEDTTPPAVTATSPPRQQPPELPPSVSRTATVTATFDEEVQNVTSSTFILERKIAVKKSLPKYVLVDATVSLNEEGIYVLDPVQDLSKGEYRATITTDVTDLADNALEEPVVWTFTVAK
jgi:hypothetical protein